MDELKQELEKNVSEKENIQNENNELNYLPVTYNIIRKERILHALEQSPVSKENFRNIFCLSSDCESDDSSKITLDIGIRLISMKIMINSRLSY